MSRRLLAALLLVAVPRAYGLATQHFGNAPVPDGWVTFTPDLRPVLNDRSRVYWYEVNGDACFYYKGDTAALNALLKAFAAGGKGREVVLHGGPLELIDLGATRRIEADWMVHVPGGITLSDHEEGGLVTDKGPALHIYVPSARPKAAAAGRLAAWVKGLDSDDFAVRAAAARELEKQGLAAGPALRAALEGTPSAEVRRAARALLGRLPSIDLGAMAIPEGLRAVGPEELAARYARGVRSASPTIRGIAASQAAALEVGRAKAVAGLLAALRKERHEYARRCLIGALGREGKASAPAVAEVRKGLDDPNVNVRNECQSALAAIEKAEADPVAAEKARTRAAIRDDIVAFLKAR